MSARRSNSRRRDIRARAIRQVAAIGRFGADSTAVENAEDGFEVSAVPADGRRLLGPPTDEDGSDGYELGELLEQLSGELRQRFGRATPTRRAVLDRVLLDLEHAASLAPALTGSGGLQ